MNSDISKGNGWIACATSKVVFLGNAIKITIFLEVILDYLNDFSYLPVKIKPCGINLFFALFSFLI